MRLSSIRKLVGFKPSDVQHLHSGVGLRRQTLDDLREDGLEPSVDSTDDDESNESEGDDEEAEADERAEAALAVANDVM